MAPGRLHLTFRFLAPSFFSRRRFWKTAQLLSLMICSRSYGTPRKRQLWRRCSSDGVQRRDVVAPSFRDGPLHDFAQRVVIALRGRFDLLDEFNQVGSKASWLLPMQAMAGALIGTRMRTPEFAKK